MRIEPLLHSSKMPLLRKISLNTHNKYIVDEDYFHFTIINFLFWLIAKKVGKVHSLDCYKWIDTTIISFTALCYSTCTSTEHKVL